MITFDNIKSYKTDFPNTWTFLWSPEEAAKIPDEHKAQIHFLNDEAKTFLASFIQNNNILTSSQNQPLNPIFFDKIEDYDIDEMSGNEIRKWLQSKPIATESYVFINAERSGQAVALTWKMVQTYFEGLFFSDDLLIFDQSLNWALFYHHEDYISFGYKNGFKKLNHKPVKRKKFYNKKK